MSFGKNGDEEGAEAQAPRNKIPNQPISLVSNGAKPFFLTYISKITDRLGEFYIE